MDEREFLEMMYQMWSKTTGAKDHYWMYEEDEHYPFDKYQNLYAIGQDEQRKHLAAYVRDEDADFITAIHGSFPDIFRRCLEAFDEADRLDLDRDEQEVQIADLEMESTLYMAENAKLREEIAGHAAQMMDAEATIEALRAETGELQEMLDGRSDTIARLEIKLEGFSTIIRKKTVRIDELESEIDGLNTEADVRDADLEAFGSEIEELRAEISKLKDELEHARAEAGYYQTRYVEDR